MADASTTPRQFGRVTAEAVFDPVASRVEVGGQVLDELDHPVVGAGIVIRSSWGVECSTTSTTLGSFGARFTAPANPVGLDVIVEALGAKKVLVVR